MFSELFRNRAIIYRQKKIPICCVCDVFTLVYTDTYCTYLFLKEKMYINIFPFIKINSYMNFLIYLKLHLTFLKFLLYQFNDLFIWLIILGVICVFVLFIVH